jgi:hypothetical protein
LGAAGTAGTGERDIAGVFAGAGVIEKINFSRAVATVSSPSRGGLRWGWGTSKSNRRTHPHPNLPLEGEGVSI